MADQVQRAPGLLGLRNRYVTSGGKHMKFSLTDYIDSTMSYAKYDKLEDGSFAGRIPKCKGVIAFAKSLRECEDLLRSTLEDWIILGLKFGHHLPVINGINLNRRPRRESVDAL